MATYFLTLSFVMIAFTQAIKEKCKRFSPYLAQHIELSSSVFTISKGRVADFLSEIEKTGELASSQSQTAYVQFYTERLIRQFDLLQQAVGKLQKKTAQKQPVFKSNYKFAKNLANLPIHRRREEYQKALRALNEKMSWLIEQSQNTQDSAKQMALQIQIQETEYRKMKCIQAIEAL